MKTKRRKYMEEFDNLEHLLARIGADSDLSSDDKVNILGNLLLRLRCGMENFIGGDTWVNIEVTLSNTNDTGRVDVSHAYIQKIDHTYIKRKFPD